MVGKRIKLAGWSSSGRQSTLDSFLAVSVSAPGEGQSSRGHAVANPPFGGSFEGVTLKPPDDAKPTLSEDDKPNPPVDNPPAPKAEEKPARRTSERQKKNTARVAAIIHDTTPSSEGQVGLPIGSTLFQKIVDMQAHHGRVTKIARRY